MARKTKQAPPAAQNVNQSEPDQIERGRQALAELPQDVADAIRAHVEAEVNKRNEEAQRRIFENINQSFAYQKCKDDLHEVHKVRLAAENDKLRQTAAAATVRAVKAELPKRRRRRKESRDEQIIRLRKEGMKQALIARKLEMSPEAVRKVCKRRMPPTGH